MVPLIVESSSSSDEESVSAADLNQPEMSSSGRRSPEQPVLEALYTHRFKHVLTDEGHAVITGIDGKLQRCEDEPIHMPGAVQAFGMMIAIHEEPDGRFQVRYVSENSKRFLGRSPQELFQLGDFLDILTDEQADNLLDHIDFIRDEDADPAINGPEVFSLSIKAPGKRTVKLWCAIHVHPGHRDMIICEFERDDDLEYPLRPPDEEIPNVPEDTLQTNPTLEELTESTEIMSRPLRVLRSARKRRGEAGAMQVFDIMSQVQEQLANAPNLEKFLKILVGIVKELTGFHRVMIYQFDSSFNGKVVTELVDPAQTRDLYKGLHFPASDIPKQARELYKLNRVRLLYDRDLESARIVCRSMAEFERPLDMTHSYLRAMSPIHLKYLANMAVRSSMSISINAFGDLWGLIACHSYGAKGMRVSFPIRKMCRLVGDTVSRNIERLSYASRLQARKLINTIPTDKNPSGYIIASSDDLLKLFDADFGMLSIREETKILGKIEQSQEALALLEYLRLRKFTSVVMTQDVKSEFPDLRYPPGFCVVAGLLYVPLSIGGNDFIVFFRKGQTREVKWAGNPYEKVIQRGTESYLEPRKSFKVWHETVLGKCREWSEEQVETSAVLCLVYGKFIEVWRQKEAALQNSRLTRLLLANSAHEVRTPLNAIINYLEIALEGSLDQETRDNLARSHSASKSLIYVINDLLDLTKTEEGQELIKDEIFDLPACIREGIDPFKIDARRKGIAYEFVEHPGLPGFVYGDQRRVRQAVANITANAVKHTTEGSIKVELYVAEVLERRVWIEIVVQDTGEGMSNTQLDALFRDLEQVSADGDDDPRPAEEDSGKDQKPKRTLGLGLAVVARILRNMDGQLRLKSEKGKGSRFVIQLPFDIPEDNSGHQTTEGTATPTAASLTASNSTAVSAVPAASRDGEVLLVDRHRSSSSANAGYLDSISPKKSFEDNRTMSDQRSITSRGSAKSNLSDADRLIDAIQMPLALGDPDPEVVAGQRRNSRGLYYNPTASGSQVAGASRSISPSDRKTRPDVVTRAESTPMPKSTAGASTEPTGVQFVTGSKVPIKPVRIPDEYQPPEPPKHSEPSEALYEITSGVDGMKVTRVDESGPPKPAKLHVLVAEDDPINVKVLRKRLEKAGHKVSHAVNGEDCASVYQENPANFDVVLMDMQMPIVDGLTSTKMIRLHEQTESHAGLSLIAHSHGHIPVIAVSASLIEREKDTYVNAGFDGWILKPIDFKRLETLLQGIVDDGIRNNCLYVPGEWERGGWFTHRVESEPAHRLKKNAGKAELRLEDIVQREEAPSNAG
jgi:light-regulated signal transduction histidine kinase (bacteriophytochrome)/CheY-like chemotaxis protein